jgi:putative PEP-CTERM system histidine kinase
MSAVRLMAGTLDYAAEDAKFLSTIADQAAAAIVAARPPEIAVAPRSLETLDRFTAAVIHDLKNSVSALSLLANNAAGNFADPEFQRDAIATLSRTVERMRRLLGRLSSPDAAAPASPTEPIDLHELIIEATTPLAADARVRLVRRLRPVQTVYGDRDALLRVVENLTTNAAEAIDHEGTVTVTLAEEQGHAVISVADTGRGIPEEYQERHLFSPFRSTKKGGWGLGLYQTKQVVEDQNGEILVESAEGRGTTFTVKLPLYADDVGSPSLESVR